MRGKALGSVFNNDINNIIYALDGEKATVGDYRGAVEAILDMRPGVLAQNVGLPDAVLYPSEVATIFDRYLEEVASATWSPDIVPEDAVRQAGVMKALRTAGTDPLTITVEACRERGIPLLASYRMNAEDWYRNTYLLSDFGREHPEWRIPMPEAERASNPDIEFTGAMDPAIPEVFDHYLAILTEVAERYDVDGIEMDFRRWYHMVSDPLENHGVLTELVRRTRRALDEISARKGRERMILGARVGPSLDSEPSPFLFPGIYYPVKPVNSSCRELGLDVQTWVKEGIVDYLAPSLFLPSLPGMPLTREFAALAEGTEVGVYPTLWPLASWMHGVCERTVRLDDDDLRPLALFKYDLTTTALRMYEDGADGISTYNWYGHLRNAKVANLWSGDGEATSGSGAEAVQTYIYPLLRDPEKLRWYLEQDWAVPG